MFRIVLALFVLVAAFSRADFNSIPCHLLNGIVADATKIPAVTSELFRTALTRTNAKAVRLEALKWLIAVRIDQKVEDPAGDVYYALSTQGPANEEIAYAGRLMAGHAVPADKMAKTIPVLVEALKYPMNGAFVYTDFVFPRNGFNPDGERLLTAIAVASKQDPEIKRAVERECDNLSNDPKDNPQRVFAEAMRDRIAAGN